jgi:autotransporter-associated beta strand protein
MITLSRKALAAAALLAAVPFLEAGVLRDDIDVQTYRDYAENRGVFQPGATNVTVYKSDGSVAGVIEVVPDFDAVNDGGYVTMFSPSFGGSVSHVDYTNAPTFAARFNDTGLAYSIFGDTYHQVASIAPESGFDYKIMRYSKIFIDAAPVPLMTDTAYITGMTGKQITRVGGGSQAVATGPGTQTAPYPGGDNYGWLSGGFNKVTRVTTGSMSETVGGVTGTYSNYTLQIYIDQVADSPLEIGTLGGDSGSPVYAWNTNTNRYELIAFNQSQANAVTGGYGKGSNLRSAPQWTVAQMNSYNDPAIVDTAGGGVISMSAADATGLGTLTQGATVRNFHGLANGVTSTTATDAQMNAAKNLIFSGAGNILRLTAASVDMGAGSMTFTGGGTYTIDDGGVNTRRLNTAGYIVEAGTTLISKITGSAGDDWRKIGAGTLRIEGSGTNSADLSLGEGLVELNRTGGAAVANVLITSGRGTVRMIGDNQISGTVAFGRRGGTLDLYGHNLSRSVIYALDDGAKITNTAANTTSTLTWTGSGAGLTQTFRGGFSDGGSLANGLLNVVINPTTPAGSVLTLRGVSNNAGGFAINGGVVVLRGYNTPHADDTIGNQPGEQFPDDWTYARISTGTVTVASGAKFTLADHARLDGNVTVASGGTFAITENLFKSTAESVEGGLAGTPSAALYGHQSGTVTLSGATSAMIATISGNTDQSVVYTRNITGAGSFTKNGVGTLTLSGNNTYAGATTISAGTLQIGNGGTSGSLGIGAVVNNGALAFNRGDAVTVANAISGSGTLAQNGTGTVTLSGNNTYAGGTTVNSGILLASSSAAFGTGGVSVGSAGNAARIQLGNGVNIANALVLGSNTGAVGRGVIEVTGTNSATWSGAITISNTTASGGHLYTDTGARLTLTGGITSSVTVVQRAGNVVLSGGGSYANYDLTGSLELGATNGVATGASLNIGVSAAGIFDLNGYNQSLAGLTKSTNAATVTNTGAGMSTLMLTNAGAVTYSGVLANGTGGIALVKSGAGTLTLSGNNTYTGGTTVSAGTLVVDGVSALGATTGALTVSGGALDLGANAVTTGAVSLNGGSIQNGTLTGSSYATNSGMISASLVGTGTLTQSGGTTTLSGNNTYTGGTTIDSGTLALGSAGALGTTVIIAFGGGTLQYSAANTTDYSARFSTAAGQQYKVDTNGQSAVWATALTSSGGTLVKSGAGTLTLSANNTYTGGTTVSAGTLLLGTTGAAGSGAITLGDANIGSANASLLWSPTANVQTLSNAITVSANGTGTATIGTTINSYTNQTFSGALSLNRATTLQAGTSDRTNFNGVISGNVGTLTLASADATTRRIVFAGGSANTYTGDTVVSANTTLQLGVIGTARNYLSDSGSVTVNGTLNLSYTSGGTETINALNGTGSVGINAGVTNRLIIGSANGSGAFSGVISGGANMAITKSGTGTQTFSGANTYTGGTIVNGGTLTAGHNTAFGTGSVTVNNTGTLNSGTGRTLANTFTINSGGALGGAATFTGSVTINSGATLTPGSTGAIGKQTFGNGVTLASGASYLWEITGNSPSVAGTDFDQIAVTGGNLSIAAGATLKLAALAVDYTGSFWDTDHDFTLATKSGTGTITGAFTLDDSLAGAYSAEGSWSLLNAGNGDIQAIWSASSGMQGMQGMSLQAVPEPSTYGLLGAGALAAVALVRRRRKKA